jgi:hypothetical protein
MKLSCFKGREGVRDDPVGSVNIFKFNFSLRLMPHNRAGKEYFLNKYRFD